MSTTQIELLLIEKDPTEFQKLQNMLRNIKDVTFSTVWAKNEQEIPVLSNLDLTYIIIIDLDMDHSSPLEVLNFLLTTFPEIPIIAVSEIQDNSLALKVVKAGAQDYLEKPLLTHYLLGRAIRYAIERKQMERERIHSQKLEALGIIAGGIAHDFNNILTAILGNISLVKMDLNASNQAETQEILKEAEDATLRAKNLANQLLTFSKGGAPVKKSLILLDLIANVATFALRGTNIKCIINYEPDTLPVECDENQLHQVLSNLILNAYQAMPKGGNITIHTENVQMEENTPFPLSPGSYVKISVFDEGIGIPEEQLSKIFDPYFTTKANGTGLGLTTCFSIIHRHEGHISVDSIVDVGTTFSIFLPADKKTAIQVQDVPKENNLKFQKKRILIMDDEKGVRNILSKMLIRLGFDVLAVTNGEETIREYFNAKSNITPFDLCILDLTIPGGMGGLEAIKNLKDHDPEVKAIVSSGYSTDPVMSNYQSYGFIGVLRKPFSFDNLQDLLLKINI